MSLPTVADLAREAGYAESEWGEVTIRELAVRLAEVRATVYLDGTVPIQFHTVRAPKDGRWFAEAIGRGGRILAKVAWYDSEHEAIVALRSDLASRLAEMRKSGNDERWFAEAFGQALADVLRVADLVIARCRDCGEIRAVDAAQRCAPCVDSDRRVQR